MNAQRSRIESVCGADRVETWVPPRAALEGFIAAETLVVLPADIAEAAELMRFAAHDNLPVLFSGAGENLFRGASLQHESLKDGFILSTRKMSRVLEYEPDDLTLVVEAGATLRDLDEHTSRHGQRLGPDPWPGQAATLGGAIAANRLGLNALRAGGLRDAVLGARVVHADGRVTKTGGKVVKNVTGYDLAKLYVGSHGSLALLAEINLRLVTRPRQTALVVCDLEAGRAHEILRRVYSSWLQPTSLLVTRGAVAPTLPSTADGMRLAVRFAGREAVVRAQVQYLLEFCPGLLLEGEEAEETYEALGEFLESDAQSLLLRISTLPVRVLETFAVLDEHVPSEAAPPMAAIAQFGVGTTHVRVAAGDEPALARAIGALRERGARVHVEYAPRGTHPPPSASIPPSTRALQESTKAVFDPDARLRGVPS